VKRLVELATNAGVLLGTASALSYACGYLALRARAYTLGTDPGFRLVDQVYVFAGARFLVTSLIVLLVLTPVILAIRWLAARLDHALPPGVSSVLQWLTLIVAAVLTLGSMGILQVNGVLLNDKAASPLALAVLGGAGGLRLTLMFAPVLLAALCLVWLYDRVEAGFGALGWVLALDVALQAFMLPIYHGALFADRRVRVLAAMPDGVRGLVEPVAVVDRTAEHATLLGADGNGQRGVVTVAFEKIEGIPVRAIVPLGEFLEQFARSKPAPARYETVWRVQLAEGGGMAEAEPATGFYASLTGYFGMILESIGSLGGASGGVAGELWVVDLDALGQPVERRRIGELSELSWPVAGADGTTYLALRGGSVVRLDADGAVSAVVTESGNWRKLLGQRPDGTVLGLVRENGETRPAQIAPDGTVWIGAAAAGEEERRALARLMQDARAYEGGRTLTVDRSERGGRGFDVYLSISGITHNLSDCGDDTCQQAAMSPDGSRVLFVRASRF
jgi:hypothetical protein